MFVHRAPHLVDDVLAEEGPVVFFRDVVPVRGVGLEDAQDVEDGELDSGAGACGVVIVEELCADAEGGAGEKRV